MKKKLLLVSSALLLSASAAFAQKVVKGHVADSNGEPVEGAVIRIPGTKVVTYSDEKGNFVIPSAPTSAKKVIISYIGMGSKTVDASSNINVVLEADNLLGEAVVMGYGSAQRVGTISGSVSSVSSKELENKAVSNVADGLQGKVTGVSIYTSSGEPSAASSITVRGVGTVTGSSAPLYIIDGVMVGAFAVQSLSPNDIETVSILKDASATSIYGARAANGVVIYTTKKGRRGEGGTLKADFMVGWSNMVSSKLTDNMMNASELEALLRGFEDGGVIPAGYMDNYLNTYTSRDFNWKDYTYRKNRKTYDVNLTYSGGSEKTDYYVGLGIYDQEGLAYKSSYTRYSAKFNVNTALKPWLTAGVNANISYVEQEQTPDGGSATNGGLFFLLSPFWSPLKADGTEYYAELVPGYKAYSLKYRGDMFTDDTNIINLTGAFYFDLNPIKGLHIKTQNSVNGYDETENYRRSSKHVAVPGNGINRKYRNRMYQWQTTNTIEYKFNVADVHSFTALVGQEWMNYNYESLTAGVEGIADDRLGELQSGTGKKTLSSGESRYSYLSFLGRLNYNYANKYFGDITLRNDKTSLLPPKTRSGWFFSLGARWKMKEESFLRSAKWIDRLDVRASYGTQGRVAIDPYEYYNLVGAVKYADASGWRLTTFGNDNLKWEKQKQFSIGAELGAFDNRLNATAEFYVKNNVDLLMQVPVPFTEGVVYDTDVSNNPYVIRNAGSLRNTGLELSLAYEVVRTKDWSVEPYVNLTYNKEEITKLFDEASDNGRYWARESSNTIWQVGKQRGFYTALWAGVDPATGAPQWYLPGDDPTVTTKDPSRVTSTYSSALFQYVGDFAKMAPNLTGGWGIRARWKGLSLNMDFAFQLNKYIINNDNYFAKNPTNFLLYNTHKSVTNYWKQPNDVAEYPSLDYNFTEFDDRLLEDASFMRLKNITLSYELPQEWLARSGFLTGARVYLTGRNLITWTSYQGLDPEVNRNLVYGGYPNTKQVSLGVNLTF